MRARTFIPAVRMGLSRGGTQNGALIWRSWAGEADDERHESAVSLLSSADSIKGSTGLRVPHCTQAKHALKIGLYEELPERGVPLRGRIDRLVIRSKSQ
jgi:hypothetical protein